MATVLVTGANRGIGLELVRQLRGRGDEIIAVCREPSAALGELAEQGGVRIESGIDVSTADGPKTLAQRLGSARIDVLVNNAGILSRESLQNMDFDAMRREYEVNSLGPLRVTHALLDNLGEGSKIAMITSRVGSIADNGSGGHYGYRMSKAALNIASVSLSIDLRPRGIAVGLLHPGWVRTDMTANTGNIDASEAAAGLIARIDELTLENSGGFWHQNGETLPW